MNLHLLMTGSGYILTDCGREGYRMRHSIMIGGTKKSHHQLNYANGSMPIRRQNGLNLRKDTGMSCCQIRLLPL